MVENEESRSYETSQIKKLKRRNQFHSSYKPGVPIFNSFFSFSSSPGERDRKGGDSGSKGPASRSASIHNVNLATFMDIGVIRCLFITQWVEDGVHWALTYLYQRQVL